MRIKVGIFMGGYSPEAEISRQSGETVFAHLNREEFEAYKVLISRDEWKVVDGASSYPLNRENLRFTKDGKPHSFDVIFNAIHGHPGEDGHMQALFALNNIPHSSSGFFESALTFNKHKTNALLQAQGIVVPRSTFVQKGDTVHENDIAKNFDFPVFIKPNRSGSSFGVTRVTEKEEINKALRAALAQDDQALIEEGIVGTEVGCGVIHLNGKTEAIALTEIVSKNAFFDYQAKYEGASDEITPARIDPRLSAEICAISERVYDYLNLWGIVRIDFIIRENTPYLIEVNSIPGLSPASIVPQQINYRNWSLPEFFGRLLKESITKNT
jgi:D-alanine-D-alanine ligase